MFGLTPLGTFHTAISLIAVVAGFIALARDREISTRSAAGAVFFWGTVITCVTGFGIFQHGGFGKPHVLGIVTLIVLGVGVAAERGRALRPAPRAVPTLGHPAGRQRCRDSRLSRSEHRPERPHGNPRTHRFALASDPRRAVLQPGAALGRRAVARRRLAHAARAGAAHAAESVGEGGRRLVGIPVRREAHADARRAQYGGARNTSVRAQTLRDGAPHPR